MATHRRPAFLLLANAGPVTGHPRFVEEMRAHGLAPLLVTDVVPTGPGAAAFAPFEVLEPIDSSQHLRILDRVSTWAGAYDIRGVLCLGEVFVEPAGLAADLLGLPFPGLRATRVCRNKHLQRRFLERWSPHSQLITPDARDTVEHDFGRGPAVLKPLDRYCSSGVQEVADLRQLAGCLEGYRPDEPLLLETKVLGREVSVESLVQDGDILFAGITGKSTNEHGGRYFVEMAHTVPCATLTPQEAAAVQEVNARVIDRLAFESGVTHAEYRVTEAGEVYLIEIACRAPGDGIIPLYQLATLSPIEPELIRCALGEKVTYPGPVRCARQVYLDHAVGRLVDVDVAGLDGVTPYWVPEHGLWPPIDAGSAGDRAQLRHLLVLKGRGAELTEVRDSFDRAITFLIDAGTPAELDRLEERVRRGIRVVTAPVSP